MPYLPSLVIRCYFFLAIEQEKIDSHLGSNISKTTFLIAYPSSKLMPCRYLHVLLSKNAIHFPNAPSTVPSMTLIPTVPRNSRRCQIVFMFTSQASVPQFLTFQLSLPSKLGVSSKKRTELVSTSQKPSSNWDSSQGVESRNFVIVMILVILVQL